ncbi:MAG TPA: aldehyde dehydrogenase family protein [Vicinamibacterales bacterium]|jgi:acyl-CoA reductase-like NAD-dependent aldehyde dehydrogenase|nr:aldehyde dehydrogenase family protein [Vicinamibacterales bacterium]
MTTTSVEQKKLLINGEWRAASGGKTMPVVNPATEEVIAEVAAADKADVDAAVAAARAALSGPWAQVSARDRGRLVWTLAERLMAKADEIARLETLHNGKPISESRHVEIPAAAECFQYYAGWADKVHGETVPVKGNNFVYTLREPVGVVAAIVPWNFPLLLAAWKVAPALACGNTVILKPASQTPLTAIALGEMASEVGFPPGVLNILTGPGSATGQAIVEHPGIDKIAFTGDTSTGKQIMRSSADTLKKITLELGGKSPNIVLPDADMEAAIRGATIGIFYGKGEVCAAGSRLLVDRSIKDAFMEKLVARTKKMVPGDPLDPKTRLGAISSKGQLERVLGYVDTAKKEGAALVAGGARADIGTGRGYFMQPTIFDNVTPQMTIAREEIFGPVLATIEFSDLDEAIARANDSPYGLAAAVWTKDVKKAHYVARRLQAGTVWVNTYNVYDTAAGFGGYKQSGFGREMGVHAIEHYTQVKTVWVDLNL